MNGQQFFTSAKQNTKYAYAVGRIRALETRLLDGMAIGRLLEADDAQEVLKALSEGEYEGSLSNISGAADFEAFQSGNIPEDIRTEQAEISRADRLVFIYPVWWAALPARMKGYIDRVFSLGFAYDFQDGMPVGLLSGKEVLIVNTTGSSGDLYSQSGMHEAIRKTSDTGIFEFCGLKVLDHLFFGAVPFVDDEVRKDYLDQFSTSLDRLF